MRVAMSVCVYYSLDHIFPKHGGGCSQRWELQCLYVYIIPLITYFPIMEGDAERNENCDVCVCILFPWSPISPNMEGLLTEMRIAMYMCILFPWPPICPTWRVLQREMRIAMSVCVYYSLDHLFHRHGGVAHSNENWNVYMYIIPLITYFSDMDGVLREMRIAMSVCAYYSIDQLFPHHGRGCAHKWELQCLYVYIIPLITYFPNMEGLLTEMRIAMYICVYYSLDHIFPKHGGGCWEKWELQCLCVYIIPLITYFPIHVWGCSHKW